MSGSPYCCSALWASQESGFAHLVQVVRHLGEFADFVNEKNFTLFSTKSAIWRYDWPPGKLIWLKRSMWCPWSEKEEGAEKRLRQISINLKGVKTKEWWSVLCLFRLESQTHDFNILSDLSFEKHAPFSYSCTIYWNFWLDVKTSLQMLTRENCFTIIDHFMAASVTSNLTLQISVSVALDVPWDMPRVATLRPRKQLPHYAIRDDVTAKSVQNNGDGRKRLELI